MTLKYRIIEQTPASNLPFFNLDERKGELKLVQELDFEKVSNYLITVGVSVEEPTEMQFSALLTVAVVVDDINDFRPTFLSSDVVEISSEVAVGRPFFEIFAADEDSGDWGVVKYSIKGGDSVEFFTIDEKTGELSLKKSLTLAKSIYSLTIRAEDGGELFTDQVLTINVRQVIINFILKIHKNEFRNSLINCLFLIAIERLFFLCFLIRILIKYIYYTFLTTFSTFIFTF